MHPENNVLDLMRSKGRVHIVDPDRSSCESVAMAFRLVGLSSVTSFDLDGFLLIAKRHHPDLIVTSMELGPFNAIDLIARARAAMIYAPVLVIEDTPKVDMAVRLIKAGAEDVFSKPVSDSTLIDAVLRGLRNGHLTMTPSPEHAVATSSGFGKLTPRERDVLEHVSNGQTNKETGRRLGISPRTVEVHRARIMEKLGARNTAELMRILFNR